MNNKYAVRDLVLYLVVVIAFYEVFTVVPSRWAEILTAKSTSSVMNSLGMEVYYGMEGNRVSMSLVSGIRPVNVYIIRECSAIHVIGVILGLVAPLKGVELSRKTLGVAIGVFSIYVMNIIRVALTLVLTGYDVPPFSWFFSSPTVETYHYPISFIFGVLGITITIMIMDKYTLPELGDFLISIPKTLRTIK